MKTLLTPKQIIELAEERVTKFAGRDAAYKLFKHYYFGGREEGRFPVLAMNAQGRPLLRQVGETAEDYKSYSSSRIPPVVDDYQAIIGRMPVTRVDPPDGSPQGEAKAEKLTKYLLSTHEISDMDRQQAEAGFFLSGLGDVAYLLEPEPDLKRPVWEIMDPQFCYPSFYGGYRRFKVYDMLVICVWEASDINAQYGDSVYVRKDAPPAERQVIKYISPYQRTVLVGSEQTQVARHAMWDLDFCPAAWAWNKQNGQFASSDISNAIQQQDFLDFCMNVLADGLVQNTYPLVVVKNPAQVGDMTIGPGATVPVQGDGDVQIRQTQGNIQAALEMMQQTASDLNASAGTSDVRQEGQMSGSIVTGKAVHAVQGPQSTRIDLKQTAIGSVVRLMNSYTLAMQEKAPHLSSAEVEIFGRYKGKSFRETLDPKQDIDGWYRNSVAFDELVGMNLQQKVQVAYEMMASKISDDLYAREVIGMEDPIGMRERVGSMMLAQAQQAAAAQGAEQGGGQQGGGQQGGPGGPGGGQPPQGGGQQQQAQIAPLIQKQRALPTPPPYPGAIGYGGSSKDEVKDALKGIADKLHGEVWATDNFALADRAQVTLAITDSRDYSLVLQAARKVDPNAKVRTVPDEKMEPFAERLV